MQLPAHSGTQRQLARYRCTHQPLSLGRKLIVALESPVKRD